MLIEESWLHLHHECTMGTAPGDSRNVVERERAKSLLWRRLMRRNWKTPDGSALITGGYWTRVRSIATGPVLRAQELQVGDKPGNGLGRCRISILWTVIV